MRARGRAGFTIAELLVVLLVGGLLALGVARMADVIGGMGEAGRSAAEARALEWAAERALRRALEDAGAGLPSAPNLGGVGVRIGSGADGVPADTLVVLRADGPGVAVATRGCPGDTPGCLALVGDQRAWLGAGRLLTVGERAGGLRALQISAEPELFFAPCGADCPERLACTVSAGASQTFARVVGSVREPGGVPSFAPCPHAHFPDGSSCREVVQAIEVGPRQEPACAAAAETSAFTAVRYVERTAMLGFPAPPYGLTRGGAGAVPAVRAVPARATRFWVREGETLVRQNGLSPAGEWRQPVSLAAPMRGLQVETLHGGVWHRGVGVGEAEMVPSSANPNYLWSAAPDTTGREPGWRFRRGHHTISAVRLRYLYRTATVAHGLPRDEEAWVVVDTRALLGGGTGDAR
jgi:prepilin-type N-terminal cleavage/methylation domain-containing protein